MEVPMDINEEQNEEKVDTNQFLHKSEITKTISIDQIMHSHEHSNEHLQEHSQDHYNDHLKDHLQEHSQEHCHGQLPEQTHQHFHQNTKAVINRLSRAIGHLEAVKKMVEDGRDCSDVLIQLAAVRSAINNTGKVILKDHIQNCIVEAIEEKDWEKIEKMNKAIDQFIK